MEGGAFGSAVIDGSSVDGTGVDMVGGAFGSGVGNGPGVDSVGAGVDVLGGDFGSGVGNGCGVGADVGLPGIPAPVFVGDIVAGGCEGLGLALEGGSVGRKLGRKETVGAGIFGGGVSRVEGPGVVDGACVISSVGLGEVDGAGDNNVGPGELEGADETVGSWEAVGSGDAVGA